MSILSLSPQDNRLFSAEIAAALEDINAAVIVQQLHYWMGKEGVGTIIGGVKYIYNSFNDWVKQFPWLSVWQFRKAMDKLRSLEIVRVIRYKAKCWNQTNYYTLNSDRLLQLLKPKSSKSTEKSEMCVTTDRDVTTPQIEVRDSTLSYIETKRTIQKETAETENESSRRLLKTEERVAAVFLENDLKQKNNTKEEIHHTQELSVSVGQFKTKSGDNQTVTTQKKSFASCSIKEIKTTKIVNPHWRSRSASPKVRSLIEELDSLGVQINKTLISLVKMYLEEEVKGAIALLKCRRQETHIPNMAGYFTAALKGGWSSASITNDEATNEEVVDKAFIFRLWYELAKELGYCSSTEIREGEQWVMISGNWEKWERAIARGYSVDYLKTVMKRNKGE